MKEIEVKLTYTSKAAVRTKLKNVGAHHTKTIHIRDTYFSLLGNDMSNSKDLVRIRQIDNISPELTFKGNCVDKKGVWDRTEINVGVHSYEKMSLILLSLGLKIIRENETTREYWGIKDLEVVFMDFEKPQKLEIMEVEGRSMSEINDFVNKLGSSVKVVGEEVFSLFD